jgi:hypothetical protein
MARYGIVMASGYSRMDDGMKIPICMYVLYIQYTTTALAHPSKTVPFTKPQLQGCLGVLLYHPVSLPPRPSFSSLSLPLVLSSDLASSSLLPATNSQEMQYI